MNKVIESRTKAELMKELAESQKFIKELQDHLNKAYRMLGYIELDNPGYVKVCHDNMVEKLFKNNGLKI